MTRVPPPGVSCCWYHLSGGDEDCHRQAVGYGADGLARCEVHLAAPPWRGPHVSPPGFRQQVVHDVREALDLLGDAATEEDWRRAGAVEMWATIAAGSAPPAAPLPRSGRRGADAADGSAAGEIGRRRSA